MTFEKTKIKKDEAVNGPLQKRLRNYLGYKNMTEQKDTKIFKMGWKPFIYLKFS